VNDDEQFEPAQPKPPRHRGSLLVIALAFLTVAVGCSFLIARLWPPTYANWPAAIGLIIGSVLAYILGLAALMAWKWGGHQ
jgi:xanthine/uracil permease